MMKKVLVLLMMSIAFVGCSDDDQNNSVEEAIEEEQEEEIQLEGSLALRATLENIKDVMQLGRTSQQSDDELCFQFEYPITLEFSNGPSAAVESYSDLLEILLNETATDHVTAIEFPFNIIQNGVTSTINDEGDFQTLVADCDYDMVSFDDVVAITDSCFTINYPISIYVNDDLQTFNSQSEGQSFFFGYSDPINSIGFDYPFDVTLIEDDSSVTINDDYELITLVEDTCGIE